MHKNDAIERIRELTRGSISIKSGQASVYKHIDTLLKLVEDRKIVLDDIITHRLPLDQAEHAYQIFNDKEDNCVKVVLKP